MDQQYHGNYYIEERRKNKLHANIFNHSQQIQLPVLCGLLPRKSDDATPANDGPKIFTKGTPSQLTSGAQARGSVLFSFSDWPPKVMLVGQIMLCFGGIDVCETSPPLLLVGSSRDTRPRSPLLLTCLHLLQSPLPTRFFHSRNRGRSHWQNLSPPPRRCL